MKRPLMLCLVAMLLAPLASPADAYQFIISGDPVAAATASSRAAASSGSALVTGTLSAPAAATSLDARYRTWDESDGIALRTDAALAFTLVIR